MIELTRGRLVCVASEAETIRMRGEFDRLHAVVLPSVLEPDLLGFILRHVDQAVFSECTHDEIGLELSMTANIAAQLLQFLVNDPELFAFVRRITGCDRIGCFTGRVYRLMPRAHHLDGWHDDLIHDRMIGLSINLSTRPYSGGLFQIRDRHSRRIIHEIANIGLGDAIVFRLAAHLEHRVTMVGDSIPKTAFAGWFRSKPDYLATRMTSR